MAENPVCESYFIRYVPSSAYFARIRVKGKLIRESLRTHAITVAKLRQAKASHAQPGASPYKRAAFRDHIDSSFGTSVVSDSALQITMQTGFYSTRKCGALKPSTSTSPCETADDENGDVTVSRANKVSLARGVIATL